MHHKKRRVLRPDDEGDVVAKVQELTGCVAHGTDESEALDNLKEVQKVWLEDCIESGQPVPEPEIEEHLPSGKWVQRVPRTLHKRLSKLAEHEHVSLNQLVTAMLPEGFHMSCVAYTMGVRCSNGTRTTCARSGRIG